MLVQAGSAAPLPMPPRAQPWCVPAHVVADLQAKWKLPGAEDVAWHIGRQFGAAILRSKLKK